MNLSSILKAARQITWALLIVLVSVGLIALVVSGIGIMNIMLVTVQQRTREIGIRKAIGGSKQRYSPAVLTGGVSDEWIRIGPRHPNSSCDSRSAWCSHGFLEICAFQYPGNP